MKLPTTHTSASLLRGFAEAPDIPILGIASDSRKLQPGYLFLACQGVTSHALDYASEAIATGASAIAWDSSTASEPKNATVPMIAVDGLSAHLGEIANRFFDYPSSVLRTIGVTGTNGKTTVAWLLAQCLQHLDRRCGYLGTLGCGVETLERGAGMTTPAAVELHGNLASFVRADATHAAIEVSSHALSQNRIDGVSFDAVMFTNLTRDHLDFHADMQSYFEAKARLFLDYQSDLKIVNLDTESGAELAARCGQDVITVSTSFDRVSNGRPYLFVRSVVATELGSDVSFTSSWGDGQFSLAMPGDFNVSNAAIVLAYLLAAGVEIDKACDVIALVEAPRGRMQRVAEPRPAVYVDYAHTPNALESALRALRPHCRGRIWCVFGCGGDRDTGKRPLMGRIAERLADNVVITTDNPRSENATEIIDEVLAGIHDTECVSVIEERAAAIAWAIASAYPSDAVLIAGKGHEACQEISGKRLPFSDLALAKAAVEAKAVAND